MKVNISYEDMHQILNEDREREERERAERERAERERVERERADRERAERQERTNDDNGGDSGGGGGGAGAEENIPVPEIMIKMRRGRRSSSTGQLVDVRGKFDIN